MTIGTLKNMIKDLADDMPVLVPIDAGFISACQTESGVGETSIAGEEAFVIMPCSCTDEKIEVEVKADDFEEPNKN